MELLYFKPSVFSDGPKLFALLGMVSHRFQLMNFLKVLTFLCDIRISIIAMVISILVRQLVFFVVITVLNEIVVAILAVFGIAGILNDTGSYGPPVQWTRWSTMVRHWFPTAVTYAAERIHLLSKKKWN